MIAYLLLIGDDITVVRMVYVYHQRLVKPLTLFFRNDGVTPFKQEADYILLLSKILVISFADLLW